MQILSRVLPFSIGSAFFSCVCTKSSAQILSEYFNHKKQQHSIQLITQSAPLAGPASIYSIIQQLQQIFEGNISTYLFQKCLHENCSILTLLQHGLQTFTGPLDSFSSKQSLNHHPANSFRASDNIYGT